MPQSCEPGKLFAQQLGLVPDGPPYDPSIRLLPGEQITREDPHPFRRPARRPSADEELMKLTGAKRLEDVGRFGPGVASRATAENRHDPDKRLFEVVFGRDSLVTAGFCGPTLPGPLPSEEIYADRLTDATVLYLARTQGLPANLSPDPADYDARREQPGRIVHEDRPENEPVALKMNVAGGASWPDYGTDDATPAFVLAALRMANGPSHQGRNALELLVRQRDGVDRTLAESVAAAIAWMDGRLRSAHVLETEPNGAHYDGKMWVGQGAYPGWADSWDAIHDVDGRVPTGPVALVEIQALAYDAYTQAARFVATHRDILAKLEIPIAMRRVLDETHLASQAARLRRGFLEHFPVHDARGRFFAVGVERLRDGTVHALAVRKSSMGHVLDSEILNGQPELVQDLVQQLMDPHKGLLAPAGIRSLDQEGRLFREGAYHNGNVWFWEQMKVADGLDRHGYHGLAWELKARMLNIVDEWHVLPEFVRGGVESTSQLNQRVVDILTVGPHGEERISCIEQPPQDILAWSAAAVRKIELQLELVRDGDPTAPPRNATDPTRRAVEDELLAGIRQRQGLASLQLFTGTLRPSVPDAEVS